MTSNLPSENDLNHEKPSIELFCESFSEDVVSTNAKNMMKIEESATQVISGDTQAMNADVHHHPQKMQPSKPDSPQAGKSSTSTGSRKVTSSDSKLNLSNSGKSNKQQEEEHLTFPFVDESFPEVPNSKSMKEKNNAVAIEACKNHFKLAYSQLKSALIDQMEQASSNINIINHLLHGELTTTDAQTLRFERDRLYLDREHFLKQLATVPSILSSPIRRDEEQEEGQQQQRQRDSSSEKIEKSKKAARPTTTNQLIPTKTHQLTPTKIKNSHEVEQSVEDLWMKITRNAASSNCGEENNALPPYLPDLYGVLLDLWRCAEFRPSPANLDKAGRRLLQIITNSLPKKSRTIKKEIISHFASELSMAIEKKYFSLRVCEELTITANKLEKDHQRLTKQVREESNKYDEHFDDVEEEETKVNFDLEVEAVKTLKNVPSTLMNTSNVAPIRSSSEKKEGADHEYELFINNFIANNTYSTIKNPSSATRR